MMKKLTLFTTIFAMLVMFASPTYAMLRVLEPELSNELKAIAKEHTASSRNIDTASITINEAWLREFFNLKVDVYMVEATIDKGLATEQKIQIPVRVDTKAVLSEADLALLVEEDNAQAPDEPVMRIMTATDTAVTNEQPADQTPPDAQDELVTKTALEEQSQAVAEDTAASQPGSNMLLYMGAAILAVAAIVGGYTAVRRRA